MTAASPDSASSSEASTPDSLTRVQSSAGLVDAVWTLLPVVASLLALTLHTSLPARQTSPVSGYYALMLKASLILALAAAVFQLFSAAWRRRYRSMAPLIAAAILLPAVLDLVTLKFALLPLPYFPGPDLIIRSLWADRGLLVECVYHSMILLLSGYFAGVLAGLATGILIGWYATCRYWLMPMLKTLGPVPATVWIPLSLVLFPTTWLSGVFLIALAVWFPVSVMTSTGISNVRIAHLEVARTMGAGRRYLVFHVALPSALPDIFIGLFMGLCAAFLTLVVAEMMGVKAGLGWYVSWAQNWTEYSKVFAAIIIITFFFSGIMTLLFKVRDRVLFWMKGVIKW
ncbi:MAG: ABC transporter permease subunit [Syntrophobacteraceae bacterium]|jgi:NitT/TauT family transport system permease protein